MPINSEQSPHTTSALNTAQRRRIPVIHSKVWLWMEWIGLYILTPPLIAALSQPALADELLINAGIENFSFETGIPSGAFIFPVLLFTFLSMLIYLRIDPTFDNKQLWNLSDLKKSLRRIMLTFAITAPIILFASWYLAYHTPYLPETGFLRLPRQLPIILVFITIFYPWVSAYPQEITHRAFFFHRYAPILGTGRTILILNILTFSWLHIPMWNPIALIMTLPAGIIFATTYLRTKSALSAGFEHAIYGIWAFACGLGYFVFTGSANGM
ncbi:MAG: CPBP family intramembrane glutamic endopeptidase [Phycisphaerales bacterium]